MTNFYPPHLHLSPPFEFRCELWCQKTRVPGLSCGIICMILSLAVLIQYWSVKDTHIHRHTTTAHTALSIASRGKNVSMCGNYDITWHSQLKINIKLLICGPSLYINRSLLHCRLMIIKSYMAMAPPGKYKLVIWPTTGRRQY